MTSIDCPSSATHIVRYCRPPTFIRHLAASAQPASSEPLIKHYFIRVGSNRSEGKKSQLPTDDVVGHRGPAGASNVEVSYVERVFFDERPPKLDVFAHEHGEKLVRATRRILVANLEQRTCVGIHRRRPQLFGVHFAKALVARQG